MTEDDKVGCPRCFKPWLNYKDGWLYCSCGYREQVKPTYEQLEQENAQLKQRISELETALREKANLLFAHQTLSGGK